MTRHHLRYMDKTELFERGAGRLLIVLRQGGVRGLVAGTVWPEVEAEYGKS